MRQLGKLALCGVAGALVVSGMVGVASAETVTLKVAMWINDVKEVAKTRALLDGYEQTHPGIKLELIQQPWDGYHDKMITLAASGLTPDVMVLSRSYLASFASRGIVQPIDNWLKTETRFDPKTDVADIKSGTYDHKVYGIPIWGGPAIMAFNPTLFQEAGEALPSDLAQTGGWTWDKAIEIGKKLTRDTNNDGTIDQYMFGGASTWDPDWVTKIWDFGGKVIDDEYSKALIDQPKAVEGLQMWADLANVYHVAPSPGKPGGDFFGGTQAVEGVWSSEAPNDHGTVNGAFAMDLVEMPAGPDGIYHVAGGCPVTIASTTAHPREAYEFATWFAMLSNEWQLRGIPASIPVIRDKYRAYLAQMFKNPDAVMNALSHSTHMEPEVGLHQSELSAAWNPILSKIASGALSAKAGATQIATKVNAILK